MIEAVLNNLRALEREGKMIYRIKLGEMFTRSDLAECTKFLDSNYSVHVTDDMAVISWR
jgi:hypothetical protein